MVKLPRTVEDKTLLNGVWRLNFKTINRLGPAGFGGYMLSSYKDPVTGMPRHLYNEEGNLSPGYFIETLTTILKPEEDAFHRNLVDWLVGHPQVGVEKNHAKVNPKYLATKDDNPRITLINLDHEDISELEEEDYIDKLVGRIVLDGGPNAISLEKLRFVLSRLEMVYRDEKYITNPKIEKEKLRQRLKKYARSSYENAQKINKVLDDLDTAKYIYQIKELNRLGIFNISNGMIKYNGNPLGTSMESVIKYFNDNIDFYKEIESVLYNRLKQEQENS